MSDNRVTLRTRQAYRTKSNRFRVVKTPGGKTRLIKIAKRGTIPTCPISGKQLCGLKATRPADLHRMSKREKTVNRPYGGCLHGSVVRERIMRAFFSEEVKALKQ